MGKRLKTLLTSAYGVRIVSLVMIAGLLLRSALLLMLSCIIWLYYLYHAIKRTDRKVEHAVYYVLSGIALTILLVEAYYLMSHFG